MEGGDSRVALFAELIKSQLTGLRLSLVEDMHRHMEAIQSLEDIPSKHHEIRTLFEIKRVCLFV